MPKERRSSFILFATIRKFSNDKNLTNRTLGGFYIDIGRALFSVTFFLTKTSKHGGGPFEKWSKTSKNIVLSSVHWSSFFNSLERNVHQPGALRRPRAHLSLSTFFVTMWFFSRVLDAANRFLGVPCVDIVAALFPQSFILLKVTSLWS